MLPYWRSPLEQSRARTTTRFVFTNATLPPAPRHLPPHHQPSAAAESTCVVGQRRWRPYELESEYSECVTPATPQPIQTDDSSPACTYVPYEEDAGAALTLATPASSEAAAASRLCSGAPLSKAPRRGFSTPFRAPPALGSLSPAAAVCSAATTLCVTRLVQSRHDENSPDRVHLEDAFITKQQTQQNEEDDEADDMTCLVLSQSSADTDAGEMTCASTRDAMPRTFRSSTAWLEARQRTLRKRARDWSSCFLRDHAASGLNRHRPAATSECAQLAFCPMVRLEGCDPSVTVQLSVFSRLSAYYARDSTTHTRVHHTRVTTAAAVDDSQDGLSSQYTSEDTDSDDASRSIPH